MKDPAGTSERLLELAHEPLTAATRAEFATLLAELSPAQQRPWLELRAEADLLHAQLAQVRLPEALPELLALPPLEARPANVAKPSSMTFRTRMYLYAASTLLILGVVSYFYLNQEPAQPKPLAAATADKLAAAAVSFHESNPPLDITSADPAAVQAALKSSAMPFAPIMLTPRAKVELLGGGHSTLAGLPCLFTRWKSGATICTLLQFDGKPQSLPKDFALTHTVPAALWHDALHYQVLFWPGPDGACTWALVLENESTPDAFSNAY